MTILDDTKRSDHTGDNSTTIFAYGFRIDDEDDIVVYLDGVVQTITTHYTVQDVGDSAGGTVTFVTKPGTGVVVAFLRDMDLYQPVDYSAYSKFPEDVHEKALDQLTMLVQQLQEQLDRAIVGAAGDDTTYTLPTYAAGEYWRWNALTETIETAALVITTESVGVEVGDLVKLVDVNSAAGFPTLSGANLNELDPENFATGVDGEIITWDSAGAAITIGPGTAGQVLESQGPGLPPVFGALEGGVKAWATWNMDDQAIDDSYGVDTIVDNGVGKTLVNFTTAFANLFYVAGSTGMELAASVIQNIPQSVNQTLISSRNSATSSLTDYIVGLMWIGEQ